MFHVYFDSVPIISNSFTTFKEAIKWANEMYRLNQDLSDVSFNIIYEHCPNKNYYERNGY